MSLFKRFVSFKLRKSTYALGLVLWVWSYFTFCLCSFYHISCSFESSLICMFLFFALTPGVFSDMHGHCLRALWGQPWLWPHSCKYFALPVISTLESKSFHFNWELKENTDTDSPFVLSPYILEKQLYYLWFLKRQAASFQFSPQYICRLGSSLFRDYFRECGCELWFPQPSRTGLAYARSCSSFRRGVLITHFLGPLCHVWSMHLSFFLCDPLDLLLLWREDCSFLEKLRLYFFSSICRI